MSPSARVFISCGQRKKTDEARIASGIARRLRRRGFECYVAVEEQTLRGLKENIFKRLVQSEYFIFIDFRRERLYRRGKRTFKDTGKHRGSLFSNQELVLATFLDTEAIAFQERDVKAEDGILRYIQANCISFRDRRSLPEVVVRRVRELNWNPNQRNELRIEREQGEFDDVPYVGGAHNPTRYYHLKVENHHDQRIAYDCVAYLPTIRSLTRNQEIPHELVDLKWKGMTNSRVAIPPGSFLRLDAFNVVHSSPNVVNLAINSYSIDFTGFASHYRLQGPDNFELTYVVYAQNFPSAKATFELRIGSRLDDIEFLRLNGH